MPLIMLFFLPGCSFPTLDHDQNMSKEVKLVFISIKEQKHSCPVWMEHRIHGRMYWNWHQVRGCGSNLKQCLGCIGVGREQSKKVFWNAVG